MTAPRVSVLVPCFNLGAWVQEAVDSVVAQTCSDWELLVVDDGSTDAETRRVLDALQAPRTTVLRTGNRGLAAARNLLLGQARGMFVCALDADDRLHPAFLERTLAAFDTDPGLTFVSCGVELFGAESGEWRQERCDLETLLGENTVATAALVRREAVLAAGGWDEAMPHMGEEDWELWLRLVKSGHRGAILPEVLFSYRRREGSMFSRCRSGPARLDLVRYVVRKHGDAYRAHALTVLLAKEREIGAHLRENSRLQMELGARRRRLARREAELRRLSDKLERARTRANTAGELARTRDALATSRAEVEALRRSASWAVTAPLRAVHSALRRLRP